MNDSLAVRLSAWIQLVASLFDLQVLILKMEAAFVKHSSCLYMVIWLSTLFNLQISSSPGSQMVQVNYLTQSHRTCSLSVGREMNDHRRQNQQRPRGFQAFVKFPFHCLY